MCSPLDLSKYGFTEAIINVGHSVILPRLRANSFLNCLMTPAMLCFHGLRAVYKTEQNYSFNNLFLKSLGLINNGKTTAGFPLGKNSRGLCFGLPVLKPHGIENARRILPRPGTEIKVIKENFRIIPRNEKNFHKVLIVHKSAGPLQVLVDGSY